jgi:hypothetical protein
MPDRFWKWLYQYCRRKVQSIHHKNHGCSVRCPWCLTWSWEVDGVKEWREENGLIRMVCKKCKGESDWSLDAALPMCITKPIRTLCS